MLRVKGTKKQSWNPLGGFIDCPSDINEDYVGELPVVLKFGGGDKVAKVDYDGCFVDPPRYVIEDYPYSVCPGVNKPMPIPKDFTKKQEKKLDLFKDLPLPVGPGPHV